MEVMKQAVEYATGAKNWKFSCKQSVVGAERGTISDELDSVRPEFLFDSLWDTVDSGKWKPVNVVEAKKMLEDLSRNEGGEKIS
ncbi:hypothetical protein CFP56_014618 [Quercus suber]|uniref:Uncharacterized protein n=1 Tax=Quercus suber TaxID=58331 RepID=A0AAW0M3Z6_QUESU